MEIWHIWIIIAILLLIGEILAPTFLVASLSIGCIAAGFFSFIDFGFKAQIISFSIGTLTAFFGVRPFMLKYAYKKSKNIKTNVDALIGRNGRVIVEIDNANNQGRILIDGEDWRAKTETDVIINLGEKVEIQKTDSNILIVKQLN